MLTWLSQLMHRHRWLEEGALRLWRWLPPRVAGFLKGVVARRWLVGAVAVMIDDVASPPEVLLVEHTYRRRGVWGLPGGSLDSIEGDPKRARDDPSPDDVLQLALRREIREELGLGIVDIRLLRLDAVPYVPEEPGPYRLDFYFRCAPEEGFAVLRRALESWEEREHSAEIGRAKLVPLTQLAHYDLYSADARLLHEDLPRLEPLFAPFLDPGP